MRYGNTVFGDDFYKSSNIQSLFHQQSLATSDQEQSSISFPNTLDLNAAGGQSVNIALPSIEQNVSQSASADSTGFFTANYEYRPEAVYGNVPLSTSYPSSLHSGDTAGAGELISLCPGTVRYHRHPEQDERA